MQAVYQGEMIRGYWQDPGQVRWRPAKTADLDTRVICGPAAQVWYGASWIFAPADATVTFQFQGHPQTYYRWFLNEEKVLEGAQAKAEAMNPSVMEKTLTLHSGWNQAILPRLLRRLLRRSGLVSVLAGPAETLWRLRLSTVPPE